MAVYQVIGDGLLWGEYNIRGKLSINFYKYASGYTQDLTGFLRSLHPSGLPRACFIAYEFSGQTKWLKQVTVELEDLSSRAKVDQPSTSQIYLRVRR